MRRSIAWSIRVFASPQEFKVTDADYNDFKAMVKKADFKYDQQSEKIMKTLKEAAKFRGYLDEASEEIKALEKKLTPLWTVTRLFL